MKSRIAPFRSGSDAYRFIKLSHPGRGGRSGVRIAELVGVRSRRSRHTGITETGFVIRVWKAGAKRWDKTLGFVRDDVALDFASVGDLARVGLVVLDPQTGEWL